MSEALSETVAQTLDALHEELLHRVVKALTVSLPIIGIPEHAENRALLHQNHMESTVSRFHQIVLAGITIDMRLIAADYDWAGRKLASMGARWEHQATLIDIYFAEALALHTWSAAEQALLEQIRDQVYQIAQEAYNETVDI